MQVRWTIPAAQDLEEIALYIQKDSESAAMATAKALFDAANSLDQLPSRGRVGRIQGQENLWFPVCPTLSFMR